LRPLRDPLMPCFAAVGHQGDVWRIVQTPKTRFVHNHAVWREVNETYPGVRVVDVDLHVHEVQKCAELGFSNSQIVHYLQGSIFGNKPFSEAAKRHVR